MAKTEATELLEWFDKEFERDMDKMGGLRSIRLDKIREILSAKSEEWLDGYNAALEDAARFIEENVQTMTDPRTMLPRGGGNRHGLEYANAIRAMKGTDL